MTAKQLSNDAVKMGALLPVENLQRRPTESRSYVAFHVQDEMSAEEFALLFTKHEVDNHLRPICIPYLSKLSPGHFVTMHGAGVRHCVVRVLGETDLRLVPLSLFQRAKRRAERNAEDIPKKSLFTDLLD